MDLIIGNNSAPKPAQSVTDEEGHMVDMSLTSFVDDVARKTAAKRHTGEEVEKVSEEHSTVHGTA